MENFPDELWASIARGGGLADDDRTVRAEVNRACWRVKQYDFMKVEVSTGDPLEELDGAKKAVDRLQKITAGFLQNEGYPLFNANYELRDVAFLVEAKSCLERMRDEFGLDDTRFRKKSTREPQIHVAANLIRELLEIRHRHVPAFELPLDMDDTPGSGPFRVYLGLACHWADPRLDVAGGLARVINEFRKLPKARRDA